MTADQRRAALDELARINDELGLTQSPAEGDEVARLRQALKFYADGDHFTRHQPEAWDTVSGEPSNFYEDENNTATVEDGSVAKAALEGVELQDERGLPLDVQPKGTVLVPVEPAPGLLMSMAIRHDHGLGMPGYYDGLRAALPDDHPMKSVTHAQRLESTLRQMRQLHEEVVGAGFYKPELEADYAAQAPAPAPEIENLRRDYARALDTIKGHAAQIGMLEQQVRELRAFRAMVNRHAPEFPAHPDDCRDVWYWQGDGQDHLESMTHQLPVVIRAEQLRELLAAAQAPAVAPSKAAQDVLAERQRQISVERWTPEHDDEHGSGCMAFAAAAYAAHAYAGPRLSTTLWNWTGWSRDGWKPKNPRADLIRAGALILAEIERLDRAAAHPPVQGSGL